MLHVSLTSLAVVLLVTQMWHSRLKFYCLDIQRIGDGSLGRAESHKKGRAGRTLEGGGDGKQRRSTVWKTPIWS